MQCHPMGMIIVGKGVTIYSVHETIWYLLYDTRRYLNPFFNRTSMMKCMTGNIFIIQKSHKQCIIWTEQWRRPEDSNQCLYNWMELLRPIYMYLTTFTIYCPAYSCNFIDSFALWTLLFVALCWPCLHAVLNINNLVCWPWECMIMWMYVCTVFTVKLNYLRVH